MISLISRACRGLLFRSPSPRALYYRAYGGIARIAEAEKGNTKFSGYYAGGFVINNVQVPGSVIASADLYLMWRPRTMAEVTPDSLAFLEIIKPAPEVLVLGCGIKVEQVPSDVAEYLARKNIKVEVLDSVGPQAADLRGGPINPDMTLWNYYSTRATCMRNATGYFNVLNSEGRVVVGALLAADPKAPLPEVMPKLDPLWERGFALSSKSPF